MFAVSAEKEQGLRKQMETLGIREEDLEEKFVRASGRGGQKVNKTSSCVYLKHLPTGIEVKCMKDRSQSLNRFLARRELVKRMELRAGMVSPETEAMEKRRRQKLKRGRRARRKYGLPFHSS